MKCGLVILIALCTFAAAMVPRDKRDVTSEDSQAKPEVSTAAPKEICAATTPCAWTIYKGNFKMIEMTIKNSYCICSADTDCLVDVDDTNAKAYVHLCKVPKNEEQELES